MGDDRDGKPGPPSRLRALWRGKVPLGEAFWLYGVAVGTFLNVLASLFFVLTNALEAPEALAIAVFYLPVPYNVFAAVVVWRSAGRYAGPPVYALLARVIALLWAIVESFI